MEALRHDKTMLISTKKVLWDSFVRTSLVDICNVMNGGFSAVITPAILRVIHVFAVSARITA